MKNLRAPLYHLNHAAAGVTLQNKAYPMHLLISRMLSDVSRQLKAYPMRPFCIHSLSHAVRCLATAEDKLSASVGMYVPNRTMQRLRDKIALDAGTLPLNLQ